MSYSITSTSGQRNCLPIQSAAIAWAERQIQLWREAGAPRIPAYTVTYSDGNPVWTSDEKGNGTLVPFVAAAAGTSKDFRAALLAKVKTHLRRLKGEGVTGIGAECLWQALGNVDSLPGAPRGTNGAYYAREVFRNVLKEKGVSSFIL